MIFLESLTSLTNPSHLNLHKRENNYILETAPAQYAQLQLSCTYTNFETDRFVKKLERSFGPIRFLFWSYFMISKYLYLQTLLKQKKASLFVFIYY